MKNIKYVLAFFIVGIVVYIWDMLANDETETESTNTAIMATGSSMVVDDNKAITLALLAKVEATEKRIAAIEECFTN